MMQDLIFRVGASRVPMSVEAFDRAYRRRITIAIAVSFVVNAFIFGWASVVGHNFLHSFRLTINHHKAPDVTFRRVSVRDLPGGGIEIVPDSGPDDSGGATVASSHSTGPKAH